MPHITRKHKVSLHVPNYFTVVTAVVDELMRNATAIFILKHHILKEKQIKSVTELHAYDIIQLYSNKQDVLKPGIGNVISLAEYATYQTSNPNKIRRNKNY